MSQHVALTVGIVFDSLIWSGHFRERLRFFIDEFREWRHVNKDHTFTPAAAFGLKGPLATKTWLHPGLHNVGKTLEASTQIFGKRVYNHLKMYGKVGVCFSCSDKRTTPA